MKCSIDDSTGFALSDFKNEARPGVLEPAGGAMFAHRARLEKWASRERAVERELVGCNFRGL